MSLTVVNVGLVLVVVLVDGLFDRHRARFGVVARGSDPAPRPGEGSLGTQRGIGASGLAFEAPDPGPIVDMMRDLRATDSGRHAWL
jgi:hypothetical protein